MNFCSAVKKNRTKIRTKQLDEVFCVRLLFRKHTKKSRVSDQIISKTCRETWSVTRGEMSGISRKEKNSEACNLCSPLTDQHRVERRYSLLPEQPLHGRPPSFKTSYAHTHAQRVLVYKYKMKFPSSAMASAKRSPLGWELWPQCGDGFRFGVYSKQSRPQLECRPQSEPDVGFCRKKRVLRETWGREASEGPSAPPRWASPEPPSPPTLRGLERGFRWGNATPPVEQNQKNKKTWRDGVRMQTAEREKEKSPSELDFHTQLDCRHPLKRRRSELHCSVCDVQKV